MKYYEKGFKGKRPTSPCYESNLFRDWEYGAGWDHYGVRGDSPRHIKNTGIGKIAILTARFPGDQEKDRKIVGIFKIAEISIGDETEETMIRADEYFRIKLPEDEAMELNFWEYYKNAQSDECFWGQGLFRYLEDMQIAQILTAVSETIKSEKEKFMVMQLLEEVKGAIGQEMITEPRGARKIEVNRNQRIARKRKYGPGGEGAEHKKLKEWIAKHPELLGLSNISKKEIEQHVFPSGDLPDIVFGLNKDMFAVVEIETNYPTPGAFQAIKYKALMCAEKGLPITSNKVQAFLVAWDIPKDVKDFCDRYMIVPKAIRI
ncbi:MAG: hypothetical protein AB9917_20055 [Negativicutes bacterium]